MFIIDRIRKEDATGELKVLYKMIEKNLGFIPPHFELLATIDIQAMKQFLDYNVNMMKHEKIDKNLMPFLRLYIAQKECRNYCTTFNRELLKIQGVSLEIIEHFGEDIDLIPFEEDQKLLLKKTLKALYQSESFNKSDLEELYAAGFSDKDFYDIVDYTTGFMGKSKLIEVYHK